MRGWPERAANPRPTTMLPRPTGNPTGPGWLERALKDFRVDPTWTGGAPAAWGTPPWHNKSLIEQTGQPKPVFFAVKSRWSRTRPFRR